MLIGDSAYPLVNYPTSWKGEPIVGWAFYIGGNTPHVWTVSEVNKLKSIYQYLVPIFTRSDPQNANGPLDAASALHQLEVLGAPTNIDVMWDYETAVDSSYEQSANAILKNNGYEMVLYGSKSTVVLNQIPAGGYDEASWTGVDTPPSSTADQFLNTATYDLNDFKNDARLWNTRPPVITPPVNSGSAAVRVLQSLLNSYGHNLAVDGEYGPLTKTALASMLHGMNVMYGWLNGTVRLVQAALCVWGYTVAVDGSFGLLTLAAVKSFQLQHKLSQDGQVGPLTQAALVS